MTTELDERRWVTSEGIVVRLSRRERDEGGVLHDVWEGDDGSVLSVPTSDGVPGDWIEL